MSEYEVELRVQYLTLNCSSGSSIEEGKMEVLKKTYFIIVL